MAYHHRHDIRRDIQVGPPSRRESKCRIAPIGRRHELETRPDLVAELTAELTGNSDGRLRGEMKSQECFHDAMKVR